MHSLDPQVAIIALLVVITAYALYLVSSLLRQLENPSTRRRKPKQTPAARPGGASPPVLPRRKVVQAASSFRQNDPDIEIVSAPSTSAPSAPEASSARARSRSRSVALAEVNPLHQADDRFRFNAIVPLSLSLAIPQSMEPSGPQTPTSIGPSSAQNAEHVPSAGPSTLNGASPAQRTASPLCHTPQRQDDDASGTQATSPPTVNGSPVKRTERKVTSPCKGKDAGQSPVTVKTPFWGPEERGVHPIRTPPDLTSQDQLAIGDVFCYFMKSGRYQLWVWMVGLDGEPRWLAVRYGYRRQDNRWLIVTPSTNVPSWVSTSRYYSLRHEMKYLDAYDESA